MNGETTLGFDKKRFIKENGSFLYGKLEAFLAYEVKEYTREDLINYLSGESINGEPYEGNMFLVYRDEDGERALIVDEVSEEWGVAHYQTRFYISIEDLIELIEDKDCT